jgi:hypothetical protein
MRIVKVLIQNYKSIVYSEEVNIDPKLTILVGKNEQGKSNFLKALKSFNINYQYLHNDLPNHLRPQLDEKSPEEIPIITLWLELDSEDKEKLKNIIGDITSSLFLKVTKYFGNNYDFQLIKDDKKEQKIEFTPPDITTYIEEFKVTAQALRDKLEVHSQRLPEFAKGKEQYEQLVQSFIQANFLDATQIDNLVKTFCTGIRGVPNQDADIQNDVAASTKLLEKTLDEINSILSQDNKPLLLKQLPVFILHSSIMDRIPDEVDITQFIGAPAKTSKGMLNLCRAAGLPIQRIQQLTKIDNPSAREVYEDHYTGHISGGINAFWTQEQYNLRVLSSLSF